MYIKKIFNTKEACDIEKSKIMRQTEKEGRKWKT